MSESEIQLIAELAADRVVAKLRPQLLDTDPHFTREEAAKYCRISVAEFDRERDRVPKLLAAARTRRPLLWRRSTLDIYRATAAATKGGA